MATHGIDPQARGLAARTTELLDSTSSTIGVGSIELGHATDTTIARISAGDVSVEGNLIYRAGGTDVPIMDGGTGGSTPPDARTNLGVPVYETLALAQAATVLAEVKSLRLLSRTTPGYGGGNYVRTSLATITAGGYPAGSYFRSTDRIMPDGSTDATNGGYWLLRENSVTPLMCGAIGDGATNDVTAIQAAVSYAAIRGISVSLGGTSYGISGSATLSSGSVVTGPGTLVQLTSGAVLKGTSLTGVNLCNFKVTGTQTVPATSTDGALTLTNCTSITITNIEIDGSYNGISATSCTGGHIAYNTITNWTLYGILTSQMDDFSVENNRIVGCLQTGAVGAYGISASGGRNSSNEQTSNSISFNVIRDVPSWDGIMMHDAASTKIIGNDIRNVRTGLDLGTNLVANNYLEKLTVIGNYIEGTNTDTWAAAAATNTGIWCSGDNEATRFRDSVISSNVVSGFNVFNTGRQVCGGICLVNASGVVVSDNRVMNNGTYANAAAGIALNGHCDKISLNGNVITTPSGQSPIVLINITGAGIISISGGVIQDENASSYAIRVATCVIGVLNISDVTTSVTARYYATGSTITSEIVSFGQIKSDLTVTTGAIADGASAQVSLSVPGAVNGSEVYIVPMLASFNGLFLSGVGTSSGIVTLTILNRTGSSVTLTNAPVRVLVQLR